MKHNDKRDFLYDMQEEVFVPYSKLIQKIYDEEQEVFQEHIKDAIERAKGGVKLDSIETIANQEKKYGTDQK